MNRIIIKRKNGIIYSLCKTSKLLRKLAGHKTLERRDLKIIEKLGYSILDLTSPVETFTSYAPEYTRDQQKQNRKLWIEALKSNKYTQGHSRTPLNKPGIGYLKWNETYSVLGVLCEITPNIPKALHQYGENTYTTYGKYNEKHALPLEARNFVGLVSTVGDFEIGDLSGMHCDGYSFYTIADIIDSEPEGLFFNASAYKIDETQSEGLFNR